MSAPPPKAIVDPAAQARQNKVRAVYGNICDVPRGQKMIDGVTITADKRIYAFKGRYFFEMKSDNSPGNGAPQLITEGWVGLPETIDTVFTGPEGYTFFFKVMRDFHWSGFISNVDKMDRVVEVF